MQLETSRLIIRDFTVGDYDFFYELETHPHSYHYEKDDRLTDYELRVKFSDILMLITNDHRQKYSLLITDKYTQKSIGRIVLWETDEDIKEWEMGWSLHPDYTKKGYATEAALSLRDFAFQTLGIHRLQALCNEANISSENVMIRLGMKKEGTLRGIRKLHDQWVNMTIYAILDRDYVGIMK